MEKQHNKPLKEKLEKREQWGSQTDFIMSCISFSVGLGNVWRFPYKAYKNGGGAFLLPYLICVVTCGIPMFFLEIALGQYMQKGVIGIWDIYPTMRGMGYSSTVIAFLTNCYYIMVVVWGGFYLLKTVMSVGDESLPWEICDETWGATTSCLNGAVGNHSFEELNPETGCKVLTNSTMGSEMAVKQYWRYAALQIGPDVDNPNTGVQPEIFAIFTVFWLICYLCVRRGTKSSGKAVYFTAIFPYIVMISLLLRAVTLPGAMTGILYLVKPQFETIFNVRVWIEAGTQVFFSYAIGIGALSALGSYNKKDSNCYKHAIMISVINSGTSLLAGLTVFAFLGVMSCQTGIPVEDVAAKGPGLAFITYPLGVSFMPNSKLWAGLFFFMLISLGFGSQIVTVQGLITALYDIIPEKYQTRVNDDSKPGFLKKLFKIETLSFLVCLTCFLIGIPFTYRSGIWIFNIFDNFAASGTTLLWLVFFESVTIGWLYGADKFYDDIQEMLGFKPNVLFKISWKYITPMMCFTIFVCSTIVDYTRMEDKEFGFEYQWWHEGLGWCLALSSMVCVPAWFLYDRFTDRGIKGSLNSLDFDVEINVKSNLAKL